MKRIAYLLALMISLVVCFACQSEKKNDPVEPEPNIFEELQGTYYSTENLISKDNFYRQTYSEMRMQTIEITKSGYFNHSFFAVTGSVKKYVNLQGQLIKFYDDLYVQTEEGTLHKIEFITVGHLLLMRYDSDKRTDEENKIYNIFHCNEDIACYANDYLNLWLKESKKIAADQGLDTIKGIICDFNKYDPETFKLIEWGSYTLPSDSIFYFARKKENIDKKPSLTEKIDLIFYNSNTPEERDTVTCTAIIQDDFIKTYNIRGKEWFEDVYNFHIKYKNYTPFNNVYPWDVMKRHYPNLRNPHF